MPSAPALLLALAGCTDLVSIPLAVETMWYVAGAIVVLIVALLAWSIGSVARGARTRDARIMEILAPLVTRLRAGDAVEPKELQELSGRPELRPMLYEALRQLGRLDLAPISMSTWESQAEGLLAYWMMHPNELRAPPGEIRCVQRVDRDLEGSTAAFFVLEYRMPDGHWAGNDPKLGVAGPFVPESMPYGGRATAFARSHDTRDAIEPAALVDRFVAMLRPTSG